MSLITNNNSSISDRNIPEAPPLVVDATTQKVQKHMVVVLPEVVANALRETQQLNEQTHKQIERLLLDRILAKPLFLLLTQEETPCATPKDASAMNDFVMKDLLPRFDAILSRIGPAKIDRILKNLLLLNTKLAKAEGGSKDLLAKAVKELSAKMGVKEIKERWDALKDRDAQWELIVDTQDLLVRHPTLALLLPKKLQLVLKTINAMKEELFSEMDLWKKVTYEQHDKKTNGIFSKLVTKYSYFDLAVKKKEFFEGLVQNLPALWNKDTAQMEQALAGIQQNFIRQLPDFVEQTIANSFESKYLWLEENIPYMHGIYNQLDDPSRNMGAGICLQAGCERQVALLQNPNMATKDVPMGCSAKGRFIRAQILFDQRQEQRVAFDSYGLNLESVRNLKGPESLDKLVEQHPEPFLLLLKEPGSIGHTINIQCDERNKIFRFFDDNIGSFAYPTKEEFLSKFTDFLNIWYGNYTFYQACFPTLAEK